jgi:glucose-6-phosphate-specific signal transduction histidine kinase
MDTTNRSALIIAAIPIVVLALFYGGGTVLGSVIQGGMMNGAQTGEFSWSWTSPLLVAVAGVVLFFLVFGKREPREQD